MIERFEGKRVLEVRYSAETTGSRERRLAARWHLSKVVGLKEMHLAQEYMLEQEGPANKPQVEIQAGTGTAGAGCGPGGL